MWRIVTGDTRKPFLEAAAALMNDAPAFKAAMIRAVHEWPNSCEMNFTAPTVNHQAWIGHAGCCIAVNSPEDITRQAWHTLIPAAQDLANQMADDAIDLWHRLYRQGVDHAEETVGNRCVDGRESTHCLDI